MFYELDLSIYPQEKLINDLFVCGPELGGQRRERHLRKVNINRV